MFENYINLILKRRYLIIFIIVALSLFFISGVRFLKLDTNFRVFFGEDNPELLAFDAFQNTYNKEDNALIVLSPKNSNVFTRKNLSAVEWLTNESWQIPYSTRVDSITNFQHIRAEDDDLIVEDLVIQADNFSDKQISYAKKIALKEPQLVNLLINKDGSVTAINITAEFPQKTAKEVPETVKFVRDLIDRFLKKYPDFEVRLTGIVMLNNAFNESSQNDIKTLIPFMYLVIIAFLYYLLRNVSAVFVIFILMSLSIASAMGVAGMLGIVITPPSASAPTIIMTLAVADSVHFFVTFLGLMRMGEDKINAIKNSFKINFIPIFLTSLTTAIGFFTMNFSDAPPFHDLGNIAAIGVILAFLFTITIVPALAYIMPFKVKKITEHKHNLIEKYSVWLTSNHKKVFLISFSAALFFIAFIVKIELNDNFVEYFDKSIKFRSDTEYTIENISGINRISYSVESGASQGINQVKFLKTLAKFKDWLIAQDEVVHVNIITDIFKRLNKSMHADDDSFYKIPDKQELNAQYLLLYEMSLPYGLDINNQINVDKSAVKVGLILKNLATKETLIFNKRVEKWLTDNAYKAMHAKGISTGIMFAHISKRNIESMLFGSSIALILISLILIVALRSIKIGFLSLIPNLLPAALALGVWALTYGRVGMAVSVVFAIAIGVIVDDTVYFLNKYLHGIRHKNMDNIQAVHYAFTTVGVALLVTTLVLIAGFFVLSQSSFLVNQQTGLLMALTIACALILDFTLLPAMLILINKIKRKSK